MDDIEMFLNSASSISVNIDSYYYRCAKRTPPKLAEKANDFIAKWG